MSNRLRYNYSYSSNIDTSILVVQSIIVMLAYVKLVFFLIFLLSRFFLNSQVHHSFFINRISNSIFGIQ